MLEARKFSDEEWESIDKEADEILNKFVGKMNISISDSSVVEVVKEWQKHISKYYYECDLEVYYGIAMLYLSDDEYKISLNSRKDGLAVFMNKAIIYYCSLNLQSA